MQAQISKKKEKRHKRWITILSIVIPIAVALLFRIKINGINLTFLPGIYATINGLTAVLLIIAVIAIKRKNVSLHKKLIVSCMILSGLFLVLYIAYHITSDSTAFGGDGGLKLFYYVVLISHILLSVVIIPFVLITYSRALLGNFEKHKKIAKFTFPLWLYVAISGVIVYIMISPYYEI